MSINRLLLLGVTLSLTFFLISCNGHSDQNTDTPAATETQVEKQAETEPIETKPIETTSAELKPAETKSVDSTDSAEPSGESKATAKAVAVEPVFTFEPVLDGETIAHTFVLKNTGTAELKILKVRTG